MDLFQLLCALVLAVAYFVMAWQSEAPGRFVVNVLLLAVAAYLGEQSCIELYGFYRYSEGWWLTLGHVPIWIPLIWPAVVLSARDMTDVLFPLAGAFRRAVVVGLFVLADSSLIEIIAVRAELWQWMERGYFGVPLIGLLGWSCFAASASFLLDHRRLRATLPLLAPVMTHALLLLNWWGGLRWVLRGDLGTPALVGFVLLLAVFGGVLLARHRRLPLEIALPRIPATLLFGGLLAAAAPGAAFLWAHFGALGLFYVLLTRVRPVQPPSGSG